MSIALRIPDDSPLMDTLSLVAHQLRGGMAVVRVDDAWLAHHGCRVKSYARLREEFTPLLRTAVRARFITERKRDAFALTVSGTILAYVELSLAEWDSALLFARV